jgi:hypothetical protein
MNIEGGLYYRIFSHSQYTCGDGGPFEFIVYDTTPDTSQSKDLLAKFPGGGIGFYYYDNSGQRVYHANPNGQAIHTSSYARNTFFRTAVSVGDRFANGLTKRIRDQNLKGAENIRLAVMSLCSHDFYHGRGEYNAIDGFARWGYLANYQALDHIESFYNTGNIVTFGGSSGAANFFVAKDHPGVTGIVMESQAGDLAALRDACYSGISVHGASEACFCPDGGPQCHAEYGNRIGFTLDYDEPYLAVQRGEINKPIYLVWNTNDSGANSYLEYENLHNALQAYNPAGQSVAREVCITRPESVPPPDQHDPGNISQHPRCNAHVPMNAEYDYLIDHFDDMTSAQLINDVYNWMMQRL